MKKTVDVPDFYAIIVLVYSFVRYIITQSVMLLEGLKGGSGKHVKRNRKRKRDFRQRFTSF